MKTHHAPAEFAEADQGLASVIDLIGGRGLYGGAITADAAKFADVAIKRIRAEVSFNRPLLHALKRLMKAPTINDFLIAAREFEAAECRAGRAPSASADATRCYLYAAISGDQKAANRVAGYALGRTFAHDLPSSDIRAHAVSTVTWLLVASGQQALPAIWTQKTAADFMRQIESGPGPGKSMVDRVIQSRQRLLAGDNASFADPTQQRVSANSSGHLQCGHNTSPALRTPVQENSSIVVFSRIGNEDIGSGERVAAEFEAVVGQRIPLAPFANMAVLHRQLLIEFPHCGDAIEAVLKGLHSSQSGKLAPILLVGPTGSGKTSFAMRFAELLGMPFEIVDCGGISDSALAGTPRRWEMGEPSLPVALIRTHYIANPIIILDDLDKVGTSRTNGTLQDALVGLLEPKTAARWRDPYLEAPADLSGIQWFGTANTLEDVPKAVRDRCMVIRLPYPGEEHLPSLTNNLMRLLCAERGLHEDWAIPLDGIELSSLARVWNGGSIRKLRRFVHVVLSAREVGNTWH